MKYKQIVNRLIAADDLHYDKEERRFVALSQQEVNEIIAQCSESGDLPPLNGTTPRERIWGWSQLREATNATRKEGAG